MEKDDIYNKLNELLGQTGGSFSILEDEIDVDLQMEYFEYSRNFKHSRELKEVLESKEDIFSSEITFEDKRKGLLNLQLLMISLLIVPLRNISRNLKQNFSDHGLR